MVASVDEVLKASLCHADLLSARGVTWHSVEIVMISLIAHGDRVSSTKLDSAGLARQLPIEMESEFDEIVFVEAVEYIAGFQRLYNAPQDCVLVGITGLEGCDSHGEGAANGDGFCNDFDELHAKLIFQHGVVRDEGCRRWQSRQQGAGHCSCCYTCEGVTNFSVGHLEKLP